MNPNDPAFPHTLTGDEKSVYLQGEKPFKENWLMGGLTKRELLAAMAMQGFVGWSRTSLNDQAEHYKSTARMSRLAADALIAELSKEVTK